MSDFFKFGEILSANNPSSTYIDVSPFLDQVMAVRNNKKLDHSDLSSIQKEFAKYGESQGLNPQDIRKYTSLLNDTYWASDYRPQDNSNSVQDTNAAQAISRALGNNPAQPTAQSNTPVSTNTTTGNSPNYDGVVGSMSFIGTPNPLEFNDATNILNNVAKEVDARIAQENNYNQSYRVNNVDTLVQEDLRPNKNRLLDSDRYAEMHNNMRDAIVNARSTLDTMLPPNMDYQTLTVLKASASDSNKVVDFIVNKLGFNSDDADAKAKLRQNINNYRNKWNSLTNNQDEKMSFNDAALAVLTSANSSNYGRTVYGEANMPTFNADDFTKFMSTKKNNLALLKQYDSLKRLAVDYINSYTSLRYRQSDIISKLNRVGRDQAKSDPDFQKQFDLLQKDLEYQYGLYNKYGTKLNQFMNNFYNKPTQQ